jgi:hypothetical protein
MIFVLSFQIKGQNSYVKYQTFDEYKMEGIKDEKIKRPYVLVKKEFDTISVIKSNDKEKTIKYINRGNYWHTVLQIKEKWFFLETICEKFIYNDTVIEYKYQYKHPIDYFSDSLKRCNQRSNCGIYVHTKNNCLDLVIQNSDITNYDAPFKEIKEFVINYKEIFPLYSSKYQPRYYSIFEKHIEQNILSIYELDGDNKKFVASKKMNSLGEFDNKGILMWW